MKKKTWKDIAEKIIVIICLLIILQSYSVSFCYIVKAIDENIDQKVEQEEIEDIEINDNAIQEFVESEVEIPEIKLEVKSENSSIYKGYLYANATSDLKYETVYNTIDDVYITGGNKMSKVILQDEPDKIVLITNTKLGLLSDMYYKQTRISVDEFEKILGETGIITLYDSEDNVIGEISQETEIIDNHYVFKYTENYNSVKMEISNIVSDGKISIKNDKAIKENTVYSRNQISLFSSINTIVNAQMIIGEEIKDYSVEGNINLEETESKMQIDVNNNSLAIGETNELVINITLKTDEEKYDLFENPTISLEFPSAVEEVEIEGINLLYKNGLSLDKWDVSTNELGKKVVNVSLIGSQLEYTPGSVQEGTTVVIYANVDVNRLTSHTSENLKMTYTNKDTIRQSYILAGKESEDVTLSFVGVQELLRATKASLNDNVVSTYNDEIKNIQVDAENETEQIVTITGTILNNFENTVDNVVIVGKIPFVDNKDGKGNNLGSTFNTKLSSEIIISGITADIYYSEKEEVTRDDDSWTKDIEDLSKYKSYKIEIKEESMVKGEKLTFEYNLSIPSKVGNNAKSYSDYIVYYSLDSQEFFSDSILGIVTEEKEITIEDIKEEDKKEVAQLTIGTQVTQAGRVLNEGDEVFERQVLEYTVVVKNTSNSIVNNILIKGNAENANLYSFVYFGTEEDLMRVKKEITDGSVEYEEFKIENLAPGESKTFKFEVITNKFSSGEKYVKGLILVSSDQTEETQVNTISNKIIDGDLSIILSKNTSEAADGNGYFTNRVITLKTDLENISDKKLKNFDVIVVVPVGIEINEEKITDLMDSDYSIEIIDLPIGKGLKISIPELEKDERRSIYFNLYVDGIDYSLESIDLGIYAYSKINDNLYYSNYFEKTFYQSITKVENTWFSDITKEIVDNGEKIKYFFTLKNIGLVGSSYAITSDFSSGLKIDSVKLIQENEEKDIELSIDENEEKYLYLMELFYPNEEIKIEIEASIDERYFDLDQIEVEAKLKVDGNNFNEFETNIISYKINNSYVTSKVEYDDNDEYKYNYEDYEYDDDEYEYNYEDYEYDDDEYNGEYNEKESYEEADYINNSLPYYTEEGSNNISQIGLNDTSILSDELNSKKTYIISGKIWIDKNKNGIKDEDEKGKGEISVRLYKSTSKGGIDISNIIGYATSNDIGEYVFEGVEEGNYVVLFEYDSEVYNITKYQVSTAKSDENSDVVSKKIAIDGISMIVGMTDVIIINNLGVINIDMGLIEKNEFDLSLEKRISKIIVKNDEGTKIYNYDNGINEKLEIRSKYYKSTILEIEYKITVKNEGDIAGYVNKIVDYLPEDMIVDLNVNPGWYQTENGDLYYNSLVGKEIAVGKEEEITLILKKSLASGEAVTIKNSAEILECTNNQGLADKDSIVNNKLESEDDMGIAVLVVSVSTGKIIQNTIKFIIFTIIFIVIIMFGKRNKQKLYR